MTKVVHVALQAISCTRNGLGEPVPVAGEAVGSTFRSDPDDVADLEDTFVIYPFGGCPVLLTGGENVTLPMTDGATFSLSSPSAEPVGLNPRFLKLGGTLDQGLGSRFVTLDHRMELPILGEGAPQLCVVPFHAPDLEVTLTFALWSHPPLTCC